MHINKKRKYYNRLWFYMKKYYINSYVIRLCCINIENNFDDTYRNKYYAQK